MAQDSLPPRAAGMVIDIGSDAENYLRYLQTLGAIPSSQWTIRSFGPNETSYLLSGVAGPSAPIERSARQLAGVSWQVAPTSVEFSYNSAFAFGENDNGVWRGRGLTTTAQTGVVFNAGVLSVSLRPRAIWTQNQFFPLMPNFQPGALAYGDPLNPSTIDRPQRFGDSPLHSIGLGQSTARVDVGIVGLGVSTANQWWGPMTEWPYILGNNAPGFPHLFLGSSHPLDVGIGYLSTRVIYGELSQSDYFRVTGAGARRFATGLIASFTPRWIEGLEVGGARFFEYAWPTGGLGWVDFRKPFEAFLKDDVAGDPGASNHTSVDNQLASAFARWVFPRSGLEIYGEFGREDHNWDIRDFLAEPDHESTLGLGLRHTWRGKDSTITGLRAEFFDMDPSNLGRHRIEDSKYLHYATVQGHTEDGQLLGAGFASDVGAASMLAWERYGIRGDKLLISATRMIVRERDQTPTIPASLDVQYALAVEQTRHVDGHLVTLGCTAVYELNRYFSADATNLLGTVRVVW